MAVRFVHVDHDTPLRLPPDSRDWISKDHMVHFIMDAVDALDLTTAKTNERGTGSAQYPPANHAGLSYLLRRHGHLFDLQIPPRE
jgi:hypothetical protein